MTDASIKKVQGRQVWDSRGRPTVEVDITLANDGFGRAIAPAGASTGAGEALDLRDGGTRFGGMGVRQAIENVNKIIAPALEGMIATNQQEIDDCLIQLDGTENRQHLGGNSMTATSMAVAHAAANGEQLPLWQYLRKADDCLLPVPEIQIFGGGAHAEGAIDLQDFMIVPFGASSFAEAMEWTAEVYHVAGIVMDETGRRCGVADEGGYWPQFDSNAQAIETLTNVIERAGFNTEQQVGISLDIAATQFYDGQGYSLKKENRILNKDEWLELLLNWIDAYPIVAIEDPFVEHDMQSHARLTKQVGDKIQVVGDDLLVTNVKNIAIAQELSACNTLLCKPNQAGTLSEAKAAYLAAKAAGWSTIVSARSGETEDVTIVHLAVGWGIEQLKVGSFSRSERMAKWNEAIRLEESLGSKATYAGTSYCKKNHVT